jgi:hypothetical protein
MFLCIEVCFDANGDLKSHFSLNFFIINKKANAVRIGFFGGLTFGTDRLIKYFISYAGNDLEISVKSLDLSDAPPTRPPSTSG